MKPNRFFNKFLRSTISVITFTMISAGCISHSYGADFTWDPANTANGSVIDPGNGTWDLTAGNIVWNNAGTNTIWANGNTAIFGGVDGAYTVSLGANVSALSLFANNSGYTISAATPFTLTLTKDSGSFGTTQTGVAANQALYIALGKTFTVGNNVTVLANGGNTGFSSTVFLAGTGSVLNIDSGGTLSRTNAANGALRFSGTGTVNLAGTISYTTGNGAVMVSSYATDNVVLNVNSGGVITTASSGSNSGGSIVINNGAGVGGTGILNINAGASVTAQNTGNTNNGVRITASGGTGTINLNGGTLTTPRVINGSGAGIFNFNGGTLQANATNNTNFFVLAGATSRANVRDGGAKINTNGFDVTISQALVHSDIGGDAAIDGGLTKSGIGTLVLSGTSTYTGATTVNGGILSLSAAGSVTSNVTVNSGGGIGGSGTINGSLTTNAGSIFSASLLAPLKVTGGTGTTIAGSTEVLFDAAPVSGTTYTILDSSTGITGFSNLVFNYRGTLAQVGNTVTATADTGTRTWNTTSGTWEIGGATTNWAEGDQKFFQGDTVVFNEPTANSTITLVGALRPTSVTVNNTTNSYTFTGAGSITGTSGLTKTGAGTLILANANTYTGATAVNGGVLQIGNGTTGSISTASAISVAAGATLSINLASGGNFTNAVANAGTVLSATANNNTLSGVISGAGGITKTGTNKLTLTGTNTFTGPVSVTGGTLSVSANANLGANASTVAFDNNAILETTNSAVLTNTHAFTIGAGGATFRIVGVSTGGQSARVTFATTNTLLGSGALTVEGNGALDPVGGAGVLVLSNSNTYNGAITLQNGGLIEFGNNTAVATTATFNLGNNSGISVVSGSTLANTINVNGTGAVLSFNNADLGIYSGPIILNQTLNVGLRDWYNLATARSGTISGVISGVGGLNIDHGTAATGGVLTLTGVNTYTGKTTINSGTLTLGATGSIANSSTIDIKAGATLNTSAVVGGMSLSSGQILTGKGTVTGLVNVTSGSKVDLVDSSIGTLTFTGGLTINSGANLRFDLGTSAGSVDTINITGGAYTFTAGTATVDIIPTGTIVAGNYDLITRTGTATGTINAANYTLSNSLFGTLAGSLISADGSKLTFVLATAGTGSATAYWTGTGGSTWATTNFSLNVDGTGAVGSIDAVTDVFFSSNTPTTAPTATTLIADQTIKTLTVRSSQTTAVGIGGAFKLSILSGLTVQAGAGSLTISTNQLEALATQVWTNNSTNAVNVSSAIIGAGGLQLTGTGSGGFVFSGANTYTAGTVINGTKLSLSGAGSLADTAALTLSGTGIFDISAITAASETIGSLEGVAGTSIVLGTKTLLVTQGGNATYAGVISGTGGFTKQGASTLILSGNNTYSGTTTITTGTLQVGAAGTSGTLGTGAVVDNGALVFNRTDALAVANNISGSGTVTQSGTGTVSLSGTNSYTGLTTLSAGTLNLNSATAIGTGAFTIAGGTIGNSSGAAITLTTNNAQNWTGNFSFAGPNDLNLGTGAVTLSANRTVTTTAANLTVGGAIGGAFSLTKAGAGTLTLAGANTFSGGTTLSAGTLNINSSTAVGTGTFNIAGGTINNTSGGAITLGNIAQTWSGDFTFTGTNNLNLGTGAVTLSANRAVTTSAGNLTVGGVIGGAFSLTKAGAGTLTLTAANTYSGGTTISAGSLVLSGAGGLADAGSVNLSASGTVLDISAITAASETIGSLAGATGSSVVLGTKNLITGDATATTYAGVISGSGGLTKQGSGSTTLSGVNTYTGATTVSGGQLLINGSITSDVTVASGATIGGFGNINGSVSVSSGGILTNSSTVNPDFTLNVNSLSLAGGSRATLAIVGNPAPGVAAVVSSGAITVTGGTVTVDVSRSAATWGFGSFNLITGSNALNVADYTKGTISGLGARQVATLTTSGNTLQLLIEGDSLVWTGNAATDPGIWKIDAAPGTDTGNTVALTNWKGKTNNANLLFTSGDAVAFDDSAVDTTVEISGNVDPNSMVFNNSTKNYDLAGTGSITGTGTLSKNGTGSLTINTVNTFSGGTTINAGTVIANSSSALGTGAVVINNGGTLSGRGSIGATTVNTGATLNNIAGSTLTASSLTFAGASTVNLFLNGGADTTTPGIAVTGNLSTVGAGTGGVTLNLTFATTTGPAGTVYKLITPGSFTGVASDFALGNPPVGLDSAQEVVLGYDGTAVIATIVGGELFWTGSKDGQWVTDATSNAVGAANWEDNGNNPKNFTGGEIVNFTDTASNFTVTINNGDVDPLQVKFDATNNYTLTGTNGITGSSELIKSGTGDLTIQNVNSYMGGTSINGGRIIATVSSALGSGGVNVNQNGTLQVNSGVVLANVINLNDGGLLTGLGSIGTVNNIDGVVSPGINSIGTLTINGDFTQGDAAQLSIDVQGTSTTDLLLVSGLATLDGTLSVNVQSGSFGSRFLFLDADSLQGQFDDVVSAGTLDPAFRLRALYDNANGDAYVVLAPTLFSDVALTPNQQQVAGALDNWINNPNNTADMDVVTMALDMLTVDQYPAAFDAISPGLHSGALSLASSLSQSTAYALHQNLSARSLNSVDYSDAYAGDYLWDLWGQATGYFNDQDINLTQGQDFESGTYLVGANRNFSHTTAIGFFGGYGDGKADYDNGSEVEFERQFFGGYLTYRNGSFYANAAVGGGSIDYDSKRRIQFGIIDRTADGTTSGDEIFAVIGAGYDFKVGDFSFGPQASLQHSKVSLDGFEEKGADSLNLGIDDTEYTSLRSLLGGRAAYTIQLDSPAALVPFVHAFWQHEFEDSQDDMGASLAGGAGPAFSYAAETPDADAFIIGAGLSVDLGETFQATFSYNLGTGDSEGDTMTGTINWKF